MAALDNDIEKLLPAALYKKGFDLCAAFSTKSYNDSTKNPEMTLKIVGYQWYWNYEYPDHGNISFDSYMVADEDILNEPT